jgi:integrase
MTGRLYQVGTMWYMAYTHRGKEYRYSCHTTSKEQAKGKLDMQLAKIRVTGCAPAHEVRLEDLVNDLLVDYRSRDLRKFADAVERRWRLHLQPFFRRVKIAELATSDFTAYRAQRREAGAAQATINRELHVLSAAFKLGYRSQPPKVERMPYIPWTPEDNARQVYMTDEQRDKLFTAAAGIGLWARTMCEMAYFLGWRIGELLQLTVGDVNLVDKTVRIATSKNGEPREAPLNDRLAMFLQQIVVGRPREAKVFEAAGCYGSFYQTWLKIAKAAGCPEVHFHDWRRTSARSKRAAGVPESVIMELQGWKTSAMFRRYAITNNDDKRRALEAVSLPIGQA